jgi:hypothetical protein
MILVTEIRMPDCKHLRYIRFPVDGGKDFDYRMRTAFNAFFHSAKRRNLKKIPDPTVGSVSVRLYHQQDWESKLSTNNMLKEITGRDMLEEHGVIDVANIKEFFALIGYDNKTKKWL